MPLFTVGQWSGTDGIDRFPSGSIPDEEDGWAMLQQAMVS